jgi:hypothetical protein
MNRVWKIVFEVMPIHPAWGMNMNVLSLAASSSNGKGGNPAGMEVSGETRHIG